MKSSALINYDEAAALFAAAGLPASTRTVRRKVWANPDVCPVDSLNYHTKQIRRRDVLRLIRKLQINKTERTK